MAHCGGRRSGLLSTLSVCLDGRGQSERSPRGEWECSAKFPCLYSNSILYEWRRTIRRRGAGNRRQRKRFKRLRLSRKRRPLWYFMIPLFFASESSQFWVYGSTFRDDFFFKNVAFLVAACSHQLAYASARMMGRLDYFAPYTPARLRTSDRPTSPPRVHPISLYGSFEKVVRSPCAFLTSTRRCVVICF